MLRRNLLAGAATLAAGASIAQTTPRACAVLSLVSDKLTVLTYQPKTGSNLGNNVVQTTEMPDRQFDKVALLAANAAFARLPAAPKVSLLAPTAADLYVRQERLFDGQRLALPTALDVAIKGTGASHLLLLTKHRDMAELRLRDMYVGDASLEGLGIYVDRITPIRNLDAGQTADGFIAPYAYLRATWADLVQGQVLTTRIIKGSRVVPAAGNATHPWDALDNQGKFNLLRAIVEDEVSRAVPALLA